MSDGDLSASRYKVLLCALVIAAVGAVAYSNSFRCSFVFDDLYFIGNRESQTLWPPWQAMFSPRFISRPLIGLSLAINYAISRYDVWSYHAVNFLIHIFAALALFGIVRRSLLTTRLRERFGAHATALALIVSMIWVAHPLQTQSVTYIIQRCESLMGLFYLLTVYCALRAFDSRRRSIWSAAAIVASALGMVSKEVMVTAPIAVVLFDGILLFPSFKEALRARWKFYTALAFTWSILVLTFIASPVNETAGFAVKSISSLDYLASEFGVVAYYLRLSVWPAGLVIDYGWPRATTFGAVIPYAALVLALAGTTVWLLIRRRPAGILGAWFFLILSITSSVVPFSDLAFEHRMYLPLAAVVTSLVIGGYVLGDRLLGRLTIARERRTKIGRLLVFAIVAAVVSSAAWAVLRRNIDYQNSLTLWRDAVRKRPHNARAYSNLGRVYIARGNSEAALRCFEKACENDPGSWVAHSNLGELLVKRGQLEAGKNHLYQALRLRPSFEYAHFNLGQVLAREGKLDEAVSHFSQAISADPGHAQAYCARGLALERKGATEEAIGDYQAARRIDPDLFEPMNYLALLLATQEDPKYRSPSEAIELAEKGVVVTHERNPAAFDTLGVTYAEAGRFPEAIQAAETALNLATEARDPELSAAIKVRLSLYREGRAHKEGPAP